MNYTPSWDLTTVPDPELYTEVGRRNNAKRTVKRGGRKKIMRKCERCALKFSAREMRQHRTECKGETI